MAHTGTWTHILEGDSVARFLESFVPTETDRACFTADHAASDISHLPVDAEDVKKDIVGIWQNKGFLTPAELKFELIAKYIPDADPGVLDFIHQVELSRNKPEMVTGYLAKEHAYLATGLAHLYAVETGLPMAMVEVDFSNMGGTNNYFRQMLAQERGVDVEQIHTREAELMTDKAVRLISAGMTADLAQLYPEERIIPIRTGGDELRILVTGVQQIEDMAYISDKLHAQIEKRVAAMGLQDHPHLKAPDDPTRNGFGAALAMQDMGAIVNTGSLIRELDAQITETKYQVGMLRLGQIDAETIEAATRGRILTGWLTVPDGQTADDIVQAALSHAQESATTAADRLRAANPVYNPSLQGGVAGFTQYVSLTLPVLESHHYNVGVLPDVLMQVKLGGAYRPDDVSPMSSMPQRYMAVAESHFVNQSGIAVSQVEKFYLGKSLVALTPKDPSAQVLMPEGMLKTLENDAADTRDFRKSFREDDPAVRTALDKAHLRSIEEVAPQALAVSIHNLAGLNGALGHHNADVMLRYIASEVIGGGLHKAGLPKDARDAVTIAHHGGGNFSVLVHPGGVDAHGKPWFSSHKLLNDARQDIKDRLKTLNEQPIESFLTAQGGTVDDSLKQFLGNRDIKTFADIEDPKPRSYVFGNATAVGRVNGLHCAIVTAQVGFEAYANGGSAGAFIGALRDRADATMDHMRSAILYQQMKSGATLPEGEQRKFTYRSAFNTTAVTIRQGFQHRERGESQPSPEDRKNQSRFQYKKPPSGQKPS